MRPSVSQTRRRRSVVRYTIDSESPAHVGSSASSLVSRLGGPSGSPPGVTGITQSTPVDTYAISRPLGDHTGPSVDLVPTEP